MDVNARKVHSFIARCLYMFLLDGTMKAYGVILEATVASFHTSRALVGPIFTLQTSVGYFIAPVVKLVEDFLSPRLVAILGGVLVTSGFVGRALVPELTLWYLLVFMSISGVGFGLVNFVTYIGLKDAYGTDFPTAYTLTAFSSYVGVAALPLLLGHLTRVYGEQGGLLAFGLLSCSLIVSGIFTFPGSKAQQSDSSRNSDEAQSLIQETEICRNNNYWLSLLAQHPQYICLSLLYVITIFEYVSWSIYLVPYGENLGLDSTRAVYLSTAGGISGILWKMFGLVIIRRRNVVLSLGLILPSILLGLAYGISSFFGEFGVLIAVASLSGFSLSLALCVCNAWLPNIVCAHHFKGAVTMCYFFSGIPTVLGGLVPGMLVDFTGNYVPAFAMLGLVSFVGTVVSVIWVLFLD